MAEENVSETLTKTTESTRKKIKAVKKTKVIKEDSDIETENTDVSETTPSKTTPSKTTPSKTTPSKTTLKQPAKQKKRGRKPIIESVKQSKSTKGKKVYNLLGNSSSIDITECVVHVPVKINEIEDLYETTSQQSQQSTQSTQQSTQPKPYDNNAVNFETNVQIQQSNSEMLSEHESTTEILSNNFNKTTKVANIQNANEVQRQQIRKLNELKSVYNIKNGKKTEKNVTNPSDYSEIERYDEEFERTVIKKELINTLIEFTTPDMETHWKEKTDICCRYCSYPFDWSPCALPVRYSNKLNKYYVMGCFCSFNCAGAFCFEEFKGSYRANEYYSLLNMLYQEVRKLDKPVKVKLALNKELLTIYGGSMSINEFREKTLLDNKDYEIVYPPMIALIPVIEENTIRHTQSQDLNKPSVQLSQKLLDQAATSNIIQRPRRRTGVTLSDFVRKVDKDTMITSM
jgi:hypothetical protein